MQLQVRQVVIPASQALILLQLQVFSWSAYRRAGFHLTYALPPQANPDNWVGSWVLWIGSGLGGEVSVSNALDGRQ